MDGEHQEFIARLPEVDGIGKPAHHQTSDRAMHTGERCRLLCDAFHSKDDGFGKGLPQAWRSTGIPALSFEHVVQCFRQKADRSRYPRSSCLRTWSQGTAAAGFWRCATQR